MKAPPALNSLTWQEGRDASHTEHTTVCHLGEHFVIILMVFSSLQTPWGAQLEDSTLHGFKKLSALRMSTVTPGVQAAPAGRLPETPFGHWTVEGKQSTSRLGSHLNGQPWTSCTGVMSPRPLHVWCSVLVALPATLPTAWHCGMVKSLQTRPHHVLVAAGTHQMRYYCCAAVAQHQVASLQQLCHHLLPGSLHLWHRGWCVQLSLQPGFTLPALSIQAQASR